MSDEATTSTLDGFCGEFEELDLSELEPLQFIIGVSTGDRDDGKLLAKTLHGPYDFSEMIGEVGDIWAEDMNHVKVYVLDKNRRNKAKWLDAKTVDYIEAKYATILMEKMIGDHEPKVYTGKAGLIGEDDVKLKAAKDAQRNADISADSV